MEEKKDGDEIILFKSIQKNNFFIHNFKEKEREINLLILSIVAE
jgi:hypothetical protein